jgi:hypothetical protein
MVYRIINDCKPIHSPIVWIFPKNSRQLTPPQHNCIGEEVAHEVVFINFFFLRT